MYKNHHQYSAYLILLTSLFFLVACQPENENEIKLGMVSGGSLVDPDKKALLLDFLEEEDIYYELHEHRGHKSVYHKAEDTARFYGLERKVLHGEKLNPNIEELLLVNGEQRRDLYIAAFKKAGVPFTIRKFAAPYPSWDIYYSQYYGPIVDQIRQEMELLNIQEKREANKEFAKQFLY